MHLTKLKTPQISGVMNCPKCLTMKMMRHFSSVKRKVTMDECPNCAGIWLDAAELHSIRDEFKSEGERRKAAEELFSEMFDSKIAVARQESKEKLVKAQSFAQAFRFICPSYFIPGKQDGGAF
jgi:Zn-finger nucleic acid-binding protein